MRANPSRAALIEADAQLAARLSALPEARRIRFNSAMAQGRKKWRATFAGYWYAAAERFHRVQYEARSAKVINLSTRMAEAVGHLAPEPLETSALRLLATPAPTAAEIVMKLRLFAVMASLPDPVADDCRSTPAERALKALSRSFLDEAAQR